MAKRQHNREQDSRSPHLTDRERRELERLADPASEDAAMRLRAQIVLQWAEGQTGEQSAQSLDTSRRTVTKWRGRFRDGGVDALADKPRPGAPRTVDAAKVEMLFRLRSTPPPSGKQRWTTRMLAQRTGLSQSTVVRIARAHAET